jgi:hypothetical protein
MEEEENKYRKRRDSGVEGAEENVTVKNGPSYSDEQQSAASPSDNEENKRNVRVCQG